MGVMDALVDPRDNKPRSVGVTDDESARFFQHIQGTDANGRKNAWIQELKAATLMLMTTTLETAHTEVEAKVQQASWIHHSLHPGKRLSTQHIPPPLHLKTGTAKARMTSGLSPHKSHGVDRDEGIMLKCSGWGKVASITSFPRSVLARSGMMVGGDLFAGSHASQLLHQVALAPPVEVRR
jgi:hypothetical protein